MDLVERLREAAEEVFPGTPVLFAYLYGSHARGEAHERSDVDIAVHLDGTLDPDEKWDLRLQLPSALERAAGLGGIDEVVVLDDAPLSLAGRIQRDGVLIYSRDEPARVRWESLTFRRFLDWERHAQATARDWLRTVAERG